MVFDPRQRSPHYPVQPEWLAQHHELALEPDLPIIDSHHHLWDRAENPYLLPDYLADTATGHRIEASIFVECGTHYRDTGPEVFRPLGEVAFAACAARAAEAQAGPAACAGIIGHIDLTAPEADAALAAAQELAGGRLVGIRQIAAWHVDPSARGSLATPPPGLLETEAFGNGLRQLTARALALDVFVYHTQLDEVTALAMAHPSQTIVLNHTGGAIGIGPYRGHRDEVFAQWRASMLTLSRLPNVRVKLGGLGMRLAGFGLGAGEAARPPSSQTLALAWAPWIESCIALFGAQRCMFESNFPVDKGSCSYAVLWNAFKRITSGASSQEKVALYSGTARATYGFPQAVRLTAAS